MNICWGSIRMTSLEPVRIWARMIHHYLGQRKTQFHWIGWLTQRYLMKMVQDANSHQKVGLRINLTDNFFSNWIWKLQIHTHIYMAMSMCFRESYTKCTLILNIIFYILRFLIHSQFLHCCDSIKEHQGSIYVIHFILGYPLRLYWN